jgi:hypothetical protein
LFCTKANKLKTLQNIQAEPNQRMSEDPFDTSHYAEVEEDGIADLDRKNQRSKLKEPPPLSEWTPSQRLALYGAVEETAKLMQKRVVRPSDPRVLNQLQRRENQRSAVTISAGVSDIFRDKNASSFDKSTQPAAFEHDHLDTNTLIVDARFIIPNYSRRFERFVEMENISNLLLPYLCLSKNMQTEVCKSNEHTNVHRFFAACVKTETTVGKLIADSDQLFGLRLYSIVIRKDATVEMVFNLDLDNRYFAVISCGQLVNFESIQRIIDQLHQETKNREERNEEPPVLGATSHDHDIEQLVAAKANGSSLDGPIGFILPDPMVPEQRLMLLSTTLIVYDATLSKLLQQQHVRPRYLYFVACQCLMRPDGVAAYEKAYTPPSMDEHSKRARK